MFNLNPVIVAKHFQYRVETFFTEVLLTNAKPFGKIVNYALCIEFQMRVSPHLHALIWCDDCPKPNGNNKQAYVDCVDKHVQAYLPSKAEDAGLHDLVTESTAILKPVENTRTFDADLTLVNFLQIIQLLQNHHALIWMKLIKLTFW